MESVTWIDIFIVLVIVFDIGLGQFLAKRSEQMAEAMPTPEDRQMMLGRARQTRLQMMVITPLLMLAFYLFWMRPAMMS